MCSSGDFLNLSFTNEHEFYGAEDFFLAFAKNLIVKTLHSPESIPSRAIVSCLLSQIFAQCRRSFWFLRRTCSGEKESLCPIVLRWQSGAAVLVGSWARLSAKQ